MTKVLADLDISLFVVATTIVHVDLTVDGVSSEGIGVFLDVNVVVVVTTAPPSTSVARPASPWATSSTSSFAWSGSWSDAPGSGEFHHHEGHKKNHKG